MNGHTAMFSAQVGLWIDPTRALIVFAKSLTAHVVESRLLSSTRFYDNVIHALGTPGPLLVCWRDRDILVELAERLRGE